MYLSELFLQNLGEEPTAREAEEAARICNRHFLEEFSFEEGQEIPLETFFQKDEKGMPHGLNKKGDELRAFWDVYKDFDGEIPWEEKKIAVVELAKRIDNCCGRSYNK